jgi:hypothetical protein
MKKRLTIYILLGSLVAVFGFQLFYTRVSSAQTVSSDNLQTPPFLVTNFPGAPQGATFQIGTSQGVVTVNNFYTVPVIVDEEYLIFQNTDQYQINYNTEISQFYIYFSSQPSAALQAQVEGDFLTLLGVSQSDACKLNVGEGYPGNLPYASQQQGLSFCNSAVQ